MPFMRPIAWRGGRWVRFNPGMIWSDVQVFDQFFDVGDSLGRIGIIHEVIDFINPGLRMRGKSIIGGCDKDGAVGLYKIRDPHVSAADVVENGTEKLRGLDVF